MKIWLLSDLNLEHADLLRELEIPNSDVCVIAGDLGRGVANGVHWLARYVVHSMPCVYVAGNHEFYKRSIDEGRTAAAKFPDMHFLENDSVVIDCARFVGATLWTDYQVVGRQEIAMRHARDA